MSHIYITSIQLSINSNTPHSNNNQAGHYQNMNYMMHILYIQKTISFNA